MPAAGSNRKARFQRETPRGIDPSEEHGRDNAVFRERLIQLDRWVEDQIAVPEHALQKVRAELRAARHAQDVAANQEELAAAAEKVAALERKRRLARREIDKVDEQADMDRRKIVAELQQKLTAKLRELFQLDQPDLDYGFYRVMHANLCEYVKQHKAEFQSKGPELFLLRNLSRGKGVGFAEASNFHPDFILWLVEGAKQYLTFVEPHGLLHESLESDKIKFAKRIKEIETRLGDSNLILNSFILSPTPYQNILWVPKPLAGQLLENHILFLEDTGPVYLPKLFGALKA